MHKREMVLALLALGAAPFASAQQTAKIPRIAVFSVTPLSAQAPWLEALRQGLRELGYVEGKNIVIEYRSAEGKLDRTQEIAAELVRLNVACIITAGPTPTRASKQATATIPIVMASGDDPVALGFVASLARSLNAPVISIPTLCSARHRHHHPPLGTFLGARRTASLRLTCLTG